MKVWITKYALSKTGIFEIENASICEGLYGKGMIRDADVKFAYYHDEGKEWHRSYEAACVRAEQMRKAKIATLRKQIARLEALTFTKEAK